MVYVVDRGIIKLRTQIDEMAPHRSKASDGTIGDPAHQARKSSHNPEHPPPAGNPDNQVDAGDFTHDPAHGADMGKISESLRLSRDRRIAYVIFNRRIFSSTGSQAWQWRPYTGSDPHTNHMHVDVNDVHHDETQDWQIGDNVSPEDVKDVQQAVVTYEYPGKGRLYDNTFFAQQASSAALAEVKELREQVTSLTAAVNELKTAQPTIDYKEWAKALLAEMNGE